MNSDSLSFKGIVISSNEYKDKDRLLSVLTRDYGLITIMAKGIAKMNSRHAFLSMSFIFCDFTVTKSGAFYYLKEASIIENNMGISSSLEGMTVAYHISELIRFSSFDNMPTQDLYELCNYAFYHLSSKPLDYKVVYAAFNWRLLHLLGFNKTYDYCDKCGSSIGNTSTYSINVDNGQFYCQACCSPYETGSIFNLNPASINALNYFIEADIKKLFNVNIDSGLVKTLMSFTTLFASVALERQITTLDSLSNLEL